MGKFMNGDKMYGTDLENLDQLNITSPGYFILFDASGSQSTITVGQGIVSDIDLANCTRIANNVIGTSDILKDNGEGGTWGDTGTYSLDNVIGQFGLAIDALNVSGDTITVGNIYVGDNDIYPASGQHWSGTQSSTSLSSVVDYIDSISSSVYMQNGSVYIGGYNIADAIGTISGQIDDLYNSTGYVPEMRTDIDNLQTDVSTLQGQTYTYERTAHTNLRDDQSVSITNDMNNVLAEISNEINRIWSSMGYYIPH